MQSKEIILASLYEIKNSIELIIKRSKHITTSDDFLKDDDGIEKLDSISMRLIAIGEAFKNIDKLSSYTLLANYPKVPWKEVKGIRDVLSHHYFYIDAETIFGICKNEIKDLLNATNEMIRALLPS